MNTRQIIVDANDKVIGHKLRPALTHDDIYRVTSLWVTNAKGEVLLAQRKWTKPNDPGKWGPAVAGTVDEGDSYETSMLKEAAEEIGLVGFKLALGPKYLIDTGIQRFFCQWFTVLVDKDIADFTIQEEEVEAIRWISIDELVKDLEAHGEQYIPLLMEDLEKLGAI